MTDQSEVLAVAAPKPPGRLVPTAALVIAVVVAASAVAVVGKAYVDRTVETKVAEAIRTQPALIAETLKAYIDQQKDEMQRKDDSVALALAPEMRDASGMPTRGPADAKTTVVYFFDANCPYCKQMEPILKPLAESGKVRVIYREIPILGPGSDTAARFGASLWKAAPDKWIEFHTAVMASRGQVNDDAVMRIALASAGPEAVGRTMSGLQDPETAAPVKRNLDLARRAGIHGTPFILVGDTMFRGAVSAEQLAAAIDGAATPPKPAR